MTTLPRGADDPYDLQRFVVAQDPVIAAVMEELRSGQKRSHWMWFVFPQIAGLGSSPMAVRYAVGSLVEAQAYARHPVLGQRLAVCTRLVNQVTGRSVRQIFGTPDDMKFRSSITLFSRAAPDDLAYRDALDRYFAGEPDTATLARLAEAPSPC